jgi:hypothetical protein
MDAGSPNSLKYLFVTMAFPFHRRFFQKNLPGSIARFSAFDRSLEPSHYAMQAFHGAGAPVL